MKYQGTPLSYTPKKKPWYSFLWTRQMHEEWEQERSLRAARAESRRVGEESMARGYREAEATRAQFRSDEARRRSTPVSASSTRYSAPPASVETDNTMSNAMAAAVIIGTVSALLSDSDGDCPAD